MTDETRRAADDAAETAETIPIVQERLQVGTRALERHVATIRLRTHEEDVPVRETLRRESVEVERRPVDLLFDEPPRTREEEGVTVIPIVEEVLVRRFRVMEELHIRRHAEDVEVEETARLRRQEARIDRADPDRDGAPAGAPGDEGAV